jgi:putative effector of murein hydrolase LrgA (UPF0299 family)
MPHTHEAEGLPILAVHMIGTWVPTHTIGVTARTISGVKIKKQQ